ncbi:MAG: hypothetical protein HFH91_19915 [Lachnospiraceae bacterium]|nr:hypothetical protein [Lachnospiraceae bacterium]
MDFAAELSLLSSRFALDYPLIRYPELLHKTGRPYTCLLLASHDDYFICIPFRTSINHKNAFLFTGTLRSRKAKSGLDYSKTVIIKDTAYLDSSAKAIVDRDEYSEMMKNTESICQKISIFHPAILSRYLIAAEHQL